MEIEDRGLVFKSWRAYAKFLEAEVRHLQQFLDSEKVKLAFIGAKKERKL